MMKKKYIIEKQETTNGGTTTTTTDMDSNEYYSDTDDTDQAGGSNKKIVFKSIVDAKYKKPVSGSRQDNLSRDDIVKKLENYIPLKTMREKEILTKLPYFKTWIRYYNTDTKQFRTGGLLMKVVYPEYIMLVNTAKNLSWSVQLKNNVIYIPDQKILDEKEKQKEKEDKIKDKLFEMYKQGLLTNKK